MAVIELTAFQDIDLEFTRGESPAFRLNFTGVDAAEVATWELTGPIRRYATAPPVDSFDVTVEGTSVTFSLTDEATTALPDHVGYQVVLEHDTSVRIPMGGRLLFRETDVC